MTGSKAAGVLASGSAVSSGSSVGSGFDFLLGGGGQYDIACFVAQLQCVQ